MAFKIPVISSVKRKRKKLDFLELDFNAVMDKREISRGSFGSVLVGKHETHGEVVIKRLQHESEEDVECFIK